MAISVFAEDIFINFYDLVSTKSIPVQPQDYSAIQSFFIKISNNEQLTKNQAAYITKILEKYKNYCLVNGFDYLEQLKTLEWKNPFRVIDLSKKIFVEKRDNGAIEICLKFPYQLKKIFEEEVQINNLPHKDNYWDPENNIRRCNLYQYNLISLYEFAVKHHFTIDESFLHAVAETEEIWQNSENILPRSQILDGQVYLINADQEVENFFQQNRNCDLFNDALLAKSMGYPLIDSIEFQLDALVSSYDNWFWIKDHDLFFKIYKRLKGRVCLILDRSANTLSWLQTFVCSADNNGIDRDDIKVCFRETKDSESGLNEWVKNAGVGGKVETGRILIFENKPAKWLFKDIENVKMLVTNNLYPPTNILTRDWMQSHPCVVYLGDTRPTEQKGHKIVKL